MREITSKIFKYIESKIGSNYQLYLVGGSARDLLLGRDFDDFDFATDCPYDVLMNSFEHVRSNYERFGIVNIKYNGCEITLACLRKEKLYLDNRHPAQVEFISDPVEDAKRRDFKINAIYIDSKGNILDPYNGRKDLKDGIISMIGDIETRIDEDPIRICRAFRFEDKLGFKLEPKLREYCEKHVYLLEGLNPHKMDIEYAKCSPKVYKIIQTLLYSSKRVLK